MSSKRILTELKGMGDSIVFMPYQRGMMGNMNAVYDLAIEEGFPAYISPAKWRYKGETYWRSMYENDVDGDVWVTHYPYETKNRLTEFHEDCLVKTLKRKGKKVAYIPYNSPGMTMNGEALKYVDVIFCDNETEGDIFRLYSKAKVVVTKMPRTKKKKARVIVICQSLLPFINDPIKRIEAYKKAMSGDDLYIFRPHPLIDGGVRNMIPQYEGEWESFKLWVRQNHIYDEGSCLESLLGAADFVLGDPGSIQNICGKFIEIAVDNTGLT